MCPSSPQVLDLPSSVVASATAPSEQPNSSYKAAVDHFIQSDGSSCLTLKEREREQELLPEVQESQTQVLQQLMASAKTLTARQDLLSTLRSERSRCFRSVISLSCLKGEEQTSRKASTVCPPRRQHLLVHTARTQGSTKLMLGDNCTRLAVKLLTSISLGRGAQLAQDTVCVEYSGAFMNPPCCVSSVCQTI